MKGFRLLLACSLLGGVAHADDTGMLPNAAVLSWPRIKIANNGDATDVIEPPDSDTLRQHLNLASCECSQAMSATDTDLYYELHLDGTTNMGLPYEMWVGSGCEGDAIIRDEQCHKISSFSDIDSLATVETIHPIPLYDLINASMANVGQACVAADGGTAGVWVLVDTDQDTNPDFFSQRSIDLGKFPDVMGFDTKPPPLPDNIRATGGEGSIELEWDIPASNAADLYAYQAFCMDADGNAIPGADKSPQFSTTLTVCGIPSSLDLVATTVESDEGTAVDVAPDPFKNLEPAFICGTQESGTATSLRIDGLENNKEYKVALVAVDFYGNPIGTFFGRTVIPKPVTDFWEDIHQRGGKIEGGFCSAGGGERALPGLLIPFALAFAWRRRRRASKAVAGAGVALALFVVRSPAAHADDFTPYWEDPSTSVEGGRDAYEDHVKWRAGIKLGPYTPDIDSQVGTNMTTGIGPYQAMFGNYYTADADGSIKAHDSHVYQILPMFDLEHVVWSRSGWLGVGGTIGYMQKTAYAYRDDGGTADTLFRIRSTASENTFRLIPFALTATYRATQLDDLYGIPLVPYVRGGLAYYIWWMKGPNGDLSKVCKDGGDVAGCDSNKAYGGTLGFVGALGLSIRAERIDRDAARSMRQSGIQHAGFYAELMASVVNGFGSDTRLSVGDKTWFAGFDFEF